MTSHIVNIRGTNGSGKTTAARMIMAQLTPVRDYKTVNGIYTHVYMNPVKHPVVFIGKYDEAASGGTDRIKNVRDIVLAVAEVAMYGHVVLEGLILSGLQQLTKDIAEAAPNYAEFHAYTLDTPLDVCIAQTLSRRAKAGNLKPFDPSKSLKPKYRAVELAQKKLNLWGLDSIVLSQAEVVTKSLQLFGVNPPPSAL